MVMNPTAVCLQAPVTPNATRAAAKVLDPITASTACTTSSNSKTTPGQITLKHCYLTLIFKHFFMDPKIWWLGDNGGNEFFFLQSKRQK